MVATRCTLLFGSLVRSSWQPEGLLLKRYLSCWRCTHQRFPNAARFGPSAAVPLVCFLPASTSCLSFSRTYSTSFVGRGFRGGVEPWLASSTAVGCHCLERRLLDAAQMMLFVQTQRWTSSTSSTGKEEEEKRRQMEKVRRNTQLGLAMMLASFGVCIVYALVSWGAPPKDEQGFPIADEFSDLPKWKQYLLRTWKEVKFYEKYFKEPSREQLLPDPLKEPYVQPPYTLVIELSGVLVHPDWTYQTGWRFKKRPAVEYFIQQIGYPTFEVVIYTAEQGFTASPIVDNLDPNGLIMYRLYRDATKYTRGHHVKDLSRLNRDLSKVILLDWDPRSFQLQPENALRLPKWEGGDEDRTLMDLAALLRAVATSGVKDVRPILEYYNGFMDPVEAFREKQKMLMEEQERQFSSAQAKDSLAKQYASRFFRFNKAGY